MERGDIRTARHLASATAANEVLERTRPDPIALLTAAAVFVAIALAAWLALFRAH
jgi:hypothetical protein